MEQLGFATILFGISERIAPFISGITSGTFLSDLNALELSITIAPLFTKSGAYFNETSFPAEKNTKSNFPQTFSSVFSTVSLSPNDIFLPSLFSDAKTLNPLIGKRLL